MVKARPGEQSKSPTSDIPEIPDVLPQILPQLDKLPDLEAAQTPSTDTDTVPAELTPGEYVVPKPAVDAIGSGNLDALTATVLGQRQAVSTAATTAPATTRGLGTLPGGTKSGYNHGRWDPVLDQIATKLGVDPLLLKSIARQENVAGTDFNPLGISPHGGGPTHYAGVEEGAAGMEAYVRAHLPHFQAVKPNDRVSVFNFAKWYSPPDAPNDPNQSNPSEGPGIFGQYHRLLEHGPVARMQEGGLVPDTDEFQGGGGAGSVGTTGGWGPEVSPEAIGAAQQTAQQYQTPMPAPVAQPVVSPAAIGAAQQAAQQYGTPPTPGAARAQPVVSTGAIGAAAQQAQQYAGSTYAEAFDDAERRYQLPPGLLHAIAGQENVDPVHNNPLGISGGGPVRSFTPDDAIGRIYRQAALLVDPHGPYRDFVRTGSIKDLAKKYSPVGARNDLRKSNYTEPAGISANLAKGYRINPNLRPQ
jgi:soluble lytic murein transglycosylase-like protein